MLSADIVQPDLELVNAALELGATIGPLPPKGDGWTFMPSSREGFIKSALLLERVLGRAPASLDNGSERDDSGDARLYQRLVALTATHEAAQPLFEGIGNFGSPTDSPAGPYYTEVRVSHHGRRASASPLWHILVNGVCVRPRTWALLPHSTRGLEARLRDPSAPLPLPDFACGGLLPDPAELQTIQESGRGSLTVRPKTYLGPREILVREIPTGVDLRAFWRAVRDIRKDTGVVVEADGNEIRVGLPRRADPQAIERMLLERGGLEVRYDVDMSLAPLLGTPRSLETILTEVAQEMVATLDDHRVLPTPPRTVLL